MTTEPVNIDRMLHALRAAVDATLDAAAFASQRAASTQRPKLRRKGPFEFVTDVDAACERRIRRALLAAMPDAGWLGEETGSKKCDRDLVWVVDPIDGTSNYACGLPHWAVSIALMHQGMPVVAAVWAEPEGALYTAIAGHGAMRNGAPLRAPKTAWDDKAVVGCQWRRSTKPPAILPAIQQQGARVRCYGSTVVQMLDVANGRLVANIQEQGHIWDLAAAALVLTEAGLLVTGWDGVPMFPAKLDGEIHLPSLAAVPGVHAKLLPRLKRQRPIVSRK